MGSFADFWENEIMDHLFGKGVYTPPTIYVGLSTADPLDDASGLAEPSGGDYTRVATAASDWTASGAGDLDDGEIENAVAILFAEATASWGTITHFALFDAATNGNMLAFGALGLEQVVESGTTVQFASGGLNVKLTKLT